ncbi:MAG: hypothetical protein R2864_14910 [Syntrophotaleaceae bacterium]
MKNSSKAEDILEALWIAIVEEGDNSISLLDLEVAPDDPALVELAGQALVEVKGARVYLRHEGRLEGEKVVRRHRLCRAFDDGYFRPQRGERQQQGL